MENPDQPNSQMNFYAAVVEPFASLAAYGWIKLVISLLVSIGIFLHGDSYVIVFALWCFILVDFITGISRAIKQRKFSAVGMGRGIVKLILYLILMIIARLFTFVNPGFFWIDDAIYIYIAITEYESIAENVNALGYPFPSLGQLQRALARLKLLKDKESNE